MGEEDGDAAWRSTSGTGTGRRGDDARSREERGPDRSVGVKPMGLLQADDGDAGEGIGDESAFGDGGA